MPSEPGGPTYQFDLVCIGSGPAGQRAAVQGAKLGSRVAIVERCRSLGGVCLDTGTIPSKTIREAVLSFSGKGSAFDRRRPPRSESPPNAEQLLERVAQVVSQEARRHRPPAAPQRGRSDLRRGVVQGPAYPDHPGRRHVA